MKIAANQTMNERSTKDVQGIQFAWDHHPEFGIPWLVAPGIWWVRLPVTSPLQAVNVYLLADGKGLTLVDCGVRSGECRDALNRALSHPDVAGHQLTKIIVTHFHPDHIGLAGEYAREGVELWTSRSTWLNCQLLLKNKQLLPLPAEVTFMQRAGLAGLDLEAFRRRAANRYGSLVAPPPDEFIPLVDGQSVTIGDRRWRIAMSFGHAAEHVSLWSENCVISGDQILPSISSNLTVPYRESDVDLIGEWIRSGRILLQFADNEALCLPGHQRPFYGIRSRLIQIEENIQRTLQRLQGIVSQPTTALDCVEQVYGRTIAAEERQLLLPEVIGMLNHLYYRGLIDRSTDQDGIYRYTGGLTKKSRRGTFARSSATDRPNDGISPDLQCDRSASNHAIPMEGLFDKISQSEEYGKPAAAKSVVRSRLSRMMVLVCMGVVAGTLYWKWDQVNDQTHLVLKRFEELQERSHRSEAVPASVVPVDTMKIVQETQVAVPRQFTGVVKPRRASQVGFNRIGVVEEILVERGDRVEPDTILARLNTDLLKANQKAILAQCRAAEARLSELLAGPRTQTIDSARAQVAAARAEVELARTSLSRATRLVAAGAVSRQDMDNATTQVATKEEALKSAQNTLDELLEGTRSEQVLAQRAQLNELEASLEQIQVQINETVLRAPFSAIVSDRFAEPGSVTAPGTPTLRLVDAGHPEVWMGVPPEYLGTLQTEKQFHVGIGEHSYDARLKSILPELNGVTRTNTVILELNGAAVDHAIFGQVARLDLTRKTDSVGYWVPLQSLTQGDQGLWALLALEATEESEIFTLKRREVEVLQVDSDRAFVRGTLESETPIVSTGVRRLTPGQRVRPTVVRTSSDRQHDAFSVASENVPSKESHE